jgi:hypothetical protein
MFLKKSYICVAVLEIILHERLVPTSGCPTNWTRFAARPIRRPSNGRCGPTALLATTDGLYARCGFLALRAQVDVAEEFGKRVRA